MQPGPSDGTATVKFVDVGQADMGFPSPGVFSFALENGMKLKSAFHMGALDTFSLAFRKGEGTNDLKTLEGKTILLGSAAWQSIADPMLAAMGVVAPDSLDGHAAIGELSLDGTVGRTLGALPAAMARSIAASIAASLAG